MSSHNALISVSSALISPTSTSTLTPAMTAVLWEIAAILDEKRVPAQVDNSVWLEVPAKRLRGPGSRGDNAWLRTCLERLNGVQVSGEYRGAWWGAVLIAEWHLEKGNETARLLITPAAVQALRAPATFARIETEAAHRMPGRAARLYAALADKKRLERTWWSYDLEELRVVLGVQGGYPSWRDLRTRVLLPALKGVNAFGTVAVRMTPEKRGRKIVGVRFDWRWKSLDEARVTAEESARATPYSERPAVGTAPPLIPETKADRRLNEEKWWSELPSAARDRRRAEIQQHQVETVQALGDLAAELSGGDRSIARQTSPSPDLPVEEVRRRAWEAAHPDEPRFDELPD